MFIVKMISSYKYPNFEFKSSSATCKEEAIKNAYNILNGLGGLDSVYQVKEVTEDDED